MYYAITILIIKELMKHFNWQLATMYDLVYEVMNSSASRVSQQLYHYRSQDNSFMVRKIQKAIIMSKIMKMREKIVELEQMLIDPDEKF